MDDVRRKPPMEGYSRPGSLGGEAFNDDEVEGHIMTDQDQDTEGHIKLPRADDDTEGHIKLPRADDDTEGHIKLPRADDEDTEGHAVRKSLTGDDDDTEGHQVKKVS